MRIIFKILAAPFVLVLTLLVAVLSFLLSLSAGLLSIPRVGAGAAECPDAVCGERHFHRDRGASDGVCHFAPLACLRWPDGCLPSWTS